MTELEKFKAAIEPYIDAWKSIDIRVVCVLAYKKWVNLGTRLILSEKSVKSHVQRESLPISPSFGAFHEVRDIKELDSLLSQIEQGVLAVIGKEIYLAKIQNDNVIVDPSGFWFNIDRRLSRRPSINFEFPTIVVGKRGESINNLLHNHTEAIGHEYLDWQLRSLEFPYDGLDDLLVSFLEIPKPPWGRVIESSLVEVIAPIRLRLGDGCELFKGKLDIHVEAVGYEKLNDITIGLIEIGNNSQRRSSHILAKTDCERVEEGFIIHKKMTVDDAYSVIIFLRFGYNALDMKMIVDSSLILKNPRILAYSHFDENLNVLKDYLEGRGKDPSKDFEIGVGLLFHFCGFNVGPYGQIKKIQKEIDLIVFVPSSNYIIAVECTVEDLDVNEKLSKISRRVKELQERLIEFSIISLIFTALERAKISKSDLKKANDERIGVVAAEEIQELLEMVGQQKQPVEILVYLQSLLPKFGEIGF